VLFLHPLPTRRSRLCTKKRERALLIVGGLSDRGMCLRERGYREGERVVLIMTEIVRVCVESVEEGQGRRKTERSICKQT
jgi:hypothetical protein